MQNPEDLKEVNGILFLTKLSQISENMSVT